MASSVAVTVLTPPSSSMRSGVSTSVAVGVGSLSSMVPMALTLVMAALLALLSVSVNDSLRSSSASLVRVTLMVCDALFTGKISVPEAAVKSVPEVAV